MAVSIGHAAIAALLALTVLVELVCCAGILTMRTPLQRIRLLLELAETVKEMAGANSEIVYEALPVDDPKQRKPDITLARELLGWSPEVSLRDGLRRTIEQSGVELLVGGGSR